jgi:hypothetical protein
MAINEGKSAARFCHSWKHRYFYLVNSHKIANNSAATEAREKVNTALESAEV